MNDAGMNSRSGLLLKDNLDKTSRKRVKQASRDLLASIKTRLAELDRFWEKEQTKADVFILDEVFASLPSPPVHGCAITMSSVRIGGGRSGTMCFRSIFGQPATARSAASSSSAVSSRPTPARRRDPWFESEPQKA